MVGFLRTIWSILRVWHQVELRSIRNSAVAMVIVPLVFIIPGVFLGAVSWTWKLIVIQIGIWTATIFLLWLAWRRLLIGSELVTIFVTTDPRLKQPISADARKGVEDYLRLVAAILASEITVGLIALWLPAHKNPLMATLILPAVMVFITHAIWQKGKSRWPSLVYKLAIFTLIASLTTIFFPQGMTEMSRRVRLDERIASAAREALPLPGEKNERKEKEAGVPQPRVAESAIFKTILASPEEWEKIYIPPHYRAHFAPIGGFVLIKPPGTEPFKDGPGIANVFDDLPPGDYLIKSVEGRQVRVDVILRPR
jgi:hypothetical protein